MARFVSFLRRALGDLLSMTAWPLEAAGSFMLWHYGDLFSSDQVLARDFRGITSQIAISQIAPDDLWGTFARFVAFGLSALCLLTWLGRLKLYRERILFAVFGLLAWGVLVYSCWRHGVPLAIFRLYEFFLGAQIYTALLLRAQAHKDVL